MLVCSIPVVAIAAGIATAIPFLLEAKSWGWYLLVLALSPGWLLSVPLAPHGPPPGSLDLGDLLNALIGRFVYWFVWIFWFVLRSDKQWRRKRAARLDA